LSIMVATSSTSVRRRNHIARPMPWSIARPATLWTVRRPWEIRLVELAVHVLVGVEVRLVEAVAVQHEPAQQRIGRAAVATGQRNLGTLAMAQPTPTYTIVDVVATAPGRNSVTCRRPAERQAVAYGEAHRGPLVRETRNCTGTRSRFASASSAVLASAAYA